MYVPFEMKTRFAEMFFWATHRATVCKVLVLLLGVAFLPVLSAAGPEAETALEPASAAELPGTRSTAVRTGTIQTKDGLTLRLTTDLGSVRIFQLEPGADPVVHYSVHIETDARGPAAQQLLDSYSLKSRINLSGVEITGMLPPQAAHSGDAQFWVQFEVTVPRGYSVEVNTEAGDIETQDIGGTASLRTQGGNIYTGRIGGSGFRDSSSGRAVAILQTEGGHIQVADVAGGLSAFTAGGHIEVGNVAGDAALRTGGGHIRAGKIGGRAELETVGGNITVAHAENFVNVHTGGGQIDFGEVRGSVHAQTGGGGIRVIYVSGPMEVESSGGSICLTRVAGAVQAATSGGTITAWINPDAASGSGTVHLGGASQLTSGNGDIVVFLPRNLAATIDATVTAGGERHIESDPALHLVIQVPNSGPGPVHALATLNGGGAPLKLRTTTGKIRLQFLDSEIALRESLMREQRERINRALPCVLPVNRRELGPDPCAVSAPDTNPEVNGDWLETWLGTLERWFGGGLHEGPDDFQKRIISSPHPAYPALAQRAGVQGMVRLQVRITKNGSVEVLKVLEGEPVLADAAIFAVKQWRAKPAWINGKNVEVISTVTFNFQLH
ncbi:MAG TPA: energy transducer TonB [Candidatus Acidoferrum sp.]|nr:energy transducer TonB [Candidatus Acidoferrum sp.]